MLLRRHAIIFKYFNNAAKSLAATHTDAKHASEKTLKSPAPDVVIPDLNLHEFFFDKMSKYGTLVATECSVTKRRYTYNDIIKLSKNFAANLRKRCKLQDDDVVLTMVPNIPENPIITLGLLQGNLVNSTANPVYTPEEIHRQITLSHAKCVITTPQLLANVQNATGKLPKPIPILVLDPATGKGTTSAGAFDFHEFLQTTDVSIVDRLPRRSPHDLAILPYSSGTTGLPKGVQLTHRNLVANLCQCCSDAVTIYEPKKEIVPGVLPLFHIYGLSIAQSLSMTYGAKLVTLTHFSSQEFISLLKDYKPTLMLAVPPIGYCSLPVLMMTNNPNVKTEDLSNMHTLVNGAAPLGQKDVDAFREKFNQPRLTIGQGYGLTETSPLISMFSRPLNVVDPASIGIPIPNTEIKVVDSDTGRTLGPNERGEMWVRGPQVMKRYHNNPKATDDTMTGEWFRTGDMVYYTEHGAVYITERLKELIKVKGFQVAPMELEELLRAHQSVADCGVVGASDPHSGEVPVAFVVKRKEVDEEAIKQFVADQVAPYKKLSRVVFVNAIPRNPSGKILRRTLRDWL